MSASPDDPAPPFRMSLSSFSSAGAFFQKLSLYSTSAWQKHRKQNGQSFEALLALQLHQIADEASNSPRQDQHCVGYSRGTDTPAGKSGAKEARAIIGPRPV